MAKLKHDALDPQCVIDTARELETRIRERFSQAALADQAARLVKIAEGAARTSARLGRTNLLLFAVTAVIVAGLVGLAAYSLAPLNIRFRTETFGELAQAVEAGLNDVILIGAGIFFLFTIDARWKRRRALKAIHRLRAFAHVVDMRQLKKDPDRVGRSEGQDTLDSPKLGMTRFELIRYLDYCSELLALVGKIAALYAQNISDSVALAAVGEVERLTMGFSSVIGQKIMILSGPHP